MPFRTITISYHCHFVPYADRYIITISYHMQIDTLWPFRTICRSIHYMTISYHMQFDTIDDHFVPYAESYEDSTFILILHHIQINVIPKYMLHVGTVKSVYLIHIINFIKCSVISTLFIILFNKDNYFVTTCRTFEVIKLCLHLIYYLLNS